MIQVPPHHAPGAYFTYRQKIMLELLYERRPHVVTYGAIADRMESVFTDDFFTPETIRAHANRARRNLRKFNLPWRIFNSWGEGYGLEPLEAG